MAELVLSCRDRASFCSSVWSSWTSAPFDLNLVAEDGVVGAHSAMVLSQSHQLAAIVKALPYSIGPTQVLLPGTSVKAVAAAKELICTGSCLLGEAIIPEVLNAVGLLGIKLSMERLCFENGAIIVPSLNIQNSGDIEEVTASDVRKSHEKVPHPSKLKAMTFCSLGLPLLQPASIIPNPFAKEAMVKFLEGARIHRQKRSKPKTIKRRRRWLKRRVPSLLYKLRVPKKKPINANSVQRTFVKRSTCIITLRMYTRLISVNSVQRSLIEENHCVNTSRLLMTGAPPLCFAANYVQ